MNFADSGEDSRQFYMVGEMNGGKAQDSHYPHVVFLSASFLKKVMNARFSDWEDQSPKIGQETNIGCPICKQGGLKLHSIERVYSKSPKKGNVISGNFYKYSCSNADCQGKFMGGCGFSVH